MTKKKAKNEIVKAVSFEESNKRIRIKDNGFDVEFENTSDNIDRALHTISGVNDRRASNAIISMAANSVIQVPDDNTEKHDSLNIVIGLLENIAPQDALEGMLAAQMVSAHNLASLMIKIATAPNQPLELAAQCMDRAAKLMNTYTNQLSALQKYRNNGKQTIQVQHVNIEAGGQAIVGNVNGRQG